MQNLNNKIEQALKLFKTGGMLVVTDDMDRENEGDLIVAAEFCTIEQMALMIRYTSGIICTPLLQSIANRLNLPPMIQNNNSLHNTAFTISVDSAKNVTTGISASDRVNTVKLLADPNSKIDDFVRPGHIFPLVAKDGGVLERRGHTEAAVDLCRLTNLSPVAVIGELMNDDGSVMIGDQLINFTKQYNFLTITIDELVQYRKSCLK
ncbi:3,4-dihydroxy-2-butanone-4-phosphate synthase [Bartonella sp. DGB1]|uniref:3,4-dihydroxy-2-butanone-4-phosphate synthase n=1 Tax=Bartonella sp. DGB1 TaxID=3239807 RepID=UPI00352426AA